MEAILNINKPAGITSFKVVKKIQNAFNINKVGHAGTLDPFATGVLLILTGKATKRAKEFLESEKEYRALLRLGMETDTGDVDGKVTANYTGNHFPTVEEVFKVVKSFEGEIEQTPPIYSAIKYKGKPLYKYARMGIEVEPKSRIVMIYSIKILSYEWPYLELDIFCSKGTYIRSLAVDIGRKLGTGAFVKKLVRTRVGEYRIEDSLQLEELLKAGIKEKISK